MDDFRVQKSLLADVKFSVFALGDSVYESHYCSAGKNLFDWLRSLSAKPLYPLGTGDQNVAQSVNGGVYVHGHGFQSLVVGYEITALQLDS